MNATVCRTLRLRPEIEAAVPRTAMVMAAGLGKRMRPLTATRPKPLVEVAGKALLDHVLDRLRAAGVERVVVNVHYLADALEAHLRCHASDLDVAISDERSLLLETGGGLKQALPLIDCDPFLAVNSDNLWVDGATDTLKLLASHWDAERMDCLLLLVPQARAGNHRGNGDFHMDPAGRLRRRTKARVAPFVFTGIQMVAKRMLDGAPDGPFSTNLLWDRAIADGRCFGVVHPGLWFDVGTPPAIRATEEALSLA
ncbi:MAG: Nucleotidyl transferase possibly involved in threonylcarbamoyladenosine formation [uncultured Sphingomonas sp.]|uniref:Nucleotidyl transferase possibly involved in threonylcarbamoyladenosine formation n=2 Tax=uncultured Sphingomonas sp. TaxID=158754 RepID=A0A6J4TPW8_9SPHN|nr:MAG: Nucleotidyl transferase possibly involved in threonylcarbamoyladenosine formation [uncultured Sphingomonas sp.]